MNLIRVGYVDGSVEYYAAWSIEDVNTSLMELWGSLANVAAISVICPIAVILKKEDAIDLPILAQVQVGE